MKKLNDVIETLKNQGVESIDFLHTGGFHTIVSNKLFESISAGKRIYGHIEHGCVLVRFYDDKNEYVTVYSGGELCQNHTI